MKDRFRKARLRPAKVVRSLFGHLLDCESYVKAMATIPRDFGTCFGVDFGAVPAIVCGGIRYGKSSLAAKLDEMARELSCQSVRMEEDFLREIVSEYLGRTDWTLAELRGRYQWIVAEHVNPGMKTFCIDNVQLFSMHQNPRIEMHGSRAIADLGIVRHWSAP